MKSNFLLYFFFVGISVQVSCQAKPENLLDYVNPLVGTQGLIFYGRTSPFVTPPFGMTDWMACTRNGRIAVCPYKYIDEHIIGFRGTHKPAMWMGDYGFVTLMPVVGNLTKDKVNYPAHFSHKKEVAKPDYYSVKLHPGSKKQIGVELTATSRCGLFRIRFPKELPRSIFIEASQLPDSNGWIKIDTAKREIIGWNSDRQSAHLGPPLPHFKGYFVIQFSDPVTGFGTWLDGKTNEGNIQQKGNACGGWVSFGSNSDMVMVRVATSFISLEQAYDNLQREIPDWNFERVRDATKELWNKYLSRIEVDSTGIKGKEMLYTAMYHSLLFPREFSEYGRYYSAFDDTIHKGVSYNDYSLWDTYRAEHPLLTIIAPDRVPEMVMSLVQMYEQGGYMPKWPNPTYTNIMIGTHADAVVADAMVKGLPRINITRAYAACWQDAMSPPKNDSISWWGDRERWHGYEARAGLYWYKKLGYIPVDKTAEACSNTLEGAYDDFCVAQVAKIAGRQQDYEMLMKRSQNYRNLFNPKTQMMAPKNADGSWSPDTHSGFTEGGPWTYLFCVQQDMPGLVQLLGGPEKFVKKLDRNFNELKYVHENEPGHHFCYLYNYANAAWKTQMRVAHFRNVKYHDTPRGLHGDDDCGQMSAWYILSALGFYQVTPGTDVYAIGTPLYPKARIMVDQFGSSKYFEVIANNVSARNIYVQSATLNGVQLKTPFIHHSDIMNGGKLVFEMGSTPKKDW